MIVRKYTLMKYDSIIVEIRIMEYFFSLKGKNYEAISDCENYKKISS